MITRSFTGLLVLMLVFSAVSFSQTSKRGSKKRSDLNLDLDKPFTTPCGVSYKNFDEVMDEADVEWRVAASSSDEVFFYNTRKQQCNRNTGIIKVWVKGEAVDSDRTTSMTRYEVKCRANQLRIMSQTEYLKNRNVSSSRTYKNPEWDEVIPDSVGERILETVCRKRL
jgi:hypothetical protein